MKLLEFDIWHQPWFLYGVAAVVGIPLLLTLFNEVINRLGEDRRALVGPLRTIRNVLLPLFIGTIVLDVLLEYERSSILIKVLETLLYILLINVAIEIINATFFSSTQGKKVDTPQLFLDILRVIVVLVGVAIVFSTVWGADLGNLITALGLGSFVIGLALQDTLGNLFSGIALVYEKPFAEGDIIEIDGERGKVIQMNWRSVRILTRDEEMVIVPHLVIGQSKVRNYSRPQEIYYVRLILGFSYDNPPNQVKEILMKTCLSTLGVLHDPPPEIKTMEYNSSSIDYEVDFAVANISIEEDVRDRFMSRVWYTAYRSGLEIPYPQRVIHNVNDAVSQEEQNRQEVERNLAELPRVLPLEEADLKKLTQYSEAKYFGRDERVIDYGHELKALYIITEGKAVMESLNSKAGSISEVARLEVGDFFGEINLFRKTFSSISVRALTDLRVIKIHAEEVETLVQDNPALVRRLEDMMDLQRMD